MDDIVMQYNKLEARIAMVEGKECDKYDYMIATFSGAVAGLIDIIFVDSPGESDGSGSRIGNWTDKMSEDLLTKIADIQIAKDTDLYNKLEAQGLKGSALRDELEKLGAPRNLSVKKGYPELKDKITYLENKYRVNYDQSIVSELGVSAKNHHLKSLAHCPDILGLCCAIIDQFTGETTFFSGSKIVRVQVGKEVELRGTNLISKLYCAFCNWIGHLLSDFCGSHSAKGRGMGIPIPFYELFQFCDFGDFPVSESDSDRGMTFADISVKAFECGYDARFGMTMAIPVILYDCMIRLLWALKQRFYHKKPWSECIPQKEHKDLRMMLIVGNMTLCVFDGTDALIKSKGNYLELLLHMNLIAWFKLAISVVKEIMIRFDFTYEDVAVQFEYLNHEMDIYIQRLKSIDYQSYEVQFEELDEISMLLSDKNSEQATIKMGEYIEEHNPESSFRNKKALLADILDPNKKVKF